MSSGVVLTQVSSVEELKKLVAEGVITQEQYDAFIALTQEEKTEKSSRFKNWLKKQIRQNPQSCVTNIAVAIGIGTGVGFGIATGGSLLIAFLAFMLGMQGAMIPALLIVVILRRLNKKN